MLSLWQFVIKYYFNLCILYQLELLIVSPQSLAPQVIFVAHNYVSIAIAMKRSGIIVYFVREYLNLLFPYNLL